VEKCTIAVDPGIVINPMHLKRQVEGGAVMGIGHALIEEVAFDESSVTQDDWASYPIPTMADLPEIKVVLLHNPKVGTYGGAGGAQGIAERLPRPRREEGARKMKSQARATGKTASRLISARIAELADWRGETLAKLRALIKAADPDVVEEWKWMGTPVWSHDGGICTGESYKAIVKLTFFKGASLKDPARLFNASLDGNTRRAIDIHEGEKIDAKAFKALIRAAVAFNGPGGKKATKRR
jgi:hypothetical protein